MCSASNAPSLPRLDVSGTDAEERMRARAALAPPPCIQPGTSCSKLAQKMPPFVPDLPSSRAHQDTLADRPNPTSVERIPASGCLRRNAAQVGVDGRARSRMCPESSQLRVMAVAPRLAAQHRARKQRLAPQGNQPLRIEILGMQGPQAHRRQASHNVARAVSCIQSRRRGVAARYASHRAPKTGRATNAAMARLSSVTATPQAR